MIFFIFVHVVFRVIPHFCNFCGNSVTGKIRDFILNNDNHLEPDRTAT